MRGAPPVRENERRSIHGLVPGPGGRIMRARRPMGPLVVMAIAVLLARAGPPPATAASPACAWKDVDGPFFMGQLLGVDAIGPHDVWAVGYATGGQLLNQAIIEHWNGRRWKVIDSPEPGSYRDFLEHVSAVSSTDVWAVGGYQSTRKGHLRLQRTLVEHWDGQRWSVTPSPNLPDTDNTLLGVAAVSTDDVWAVGVATGADASSKSLAEHWNGTSWTIVPTKDPGAESNVLSSVSVVSPTDVWSVGSYSNATFGQPKTLSEHWDGTAWTRVSSPNLGTMGDAFRGVAAVSADDVWAVGLYEYLAPDGSLLTATMSDHWNGRRWRTVTTPDPPGGDSLLNGVTALAQDEVWTVGYSTQGAIIMEWNGDAWAALDGPSGRSRSLWSVTALGQHDTWAVGSIALDFLIMRGC